MISAPKSPARCRATVRRHDRSPGSWARTRSPGCVRHGGERRADDCTGAELRRFARHAVGGAVDAITLTFSPVLRPSRRGRASAGFPAAPTPPPTLPSMSTVWAPRPSKRARAQLCGRIYRGIRLISRPFYNAHRLHPAQSGWFGRTSASTTEVLIGTDAAKVCPLPMP